MTKSTYTLTITVDDEEPGSLILVEDLKHAQTAWIDTEAGTFPFVAENVHQGDLAERIQTLWINNRACIPMAAREDSRILDLHLPKDQDLTVCPGARGKTKSHYVANGAANSPNRLCQDCRSHL